LIYLEGVSPNIAPIALEFLKRGGHVDGGAIGQCDHGADPGGKRKPRLRRALATEL
jgi:hypothetical protein